MISETVVLLFICLLGPAWQGASRVSTEAVLSASAPLAQA
jgi:hypothetical protein